MHYAVIMHYAALCCLVVLSLRAGSRPKWPASYPSPAAYFCLSKIYINKQNVMLQQIVACYQFPPCFGIERISVKVDGQKRVEVGVL